MTVISVENLSKSYRLGAIGGGTLREDLSRWWARARAKTDPTGTIGHEHQARHIGQEFWALRDISFQVKEGEILGVIGHNGAGKSTLLKILSRVTGPTSGLVKIKGRIASLLEVGTGFHPELTGRENIFLNGTILGMMKAEIRRKLDEIIAFSEIEEFIDTPVKRYSSGMYVRLAFAVAAHLDPEILIVDEVLAVGDAQFQKKCLGKMGEVAQGGRTVLFVSHSMDAISRLCSTALLLKDGATEFIGPTSRAVQSYLANLTQMAKPGQWIQVGSPTREGQKKAAYFESASYSGSAEGLWPVSGKEFCAKVRIRSDEPRMVPSLAVTLCTRAQQKLVNADTVLIDQVIRLEKGLNEVHLNLHRVHLKPGTYLVSLWLALSVNNVLDYLETAFEVQITDESGSRLDSEIRGDGTVTCEFSIRECGLVPG
jgi:lipopolysaccharide transport system ATP-binding protein